MCLNFALVVLPAILISDLSGCHKQGASDPAVEFRRRHPGEAAKYRYIIPVEMGLCDAMVTTKSVIVTEVAGTLTSQFSNCQGVADFSSSLMRMEKNSRRLWSQMLAELDSERRSGGSLHQFEAIEGEDMVTGVLIIKKGEIAQRFDLGRRRAAAQDQAGKLNR